MQGSPKGKLGALDWRKLAISLGLSIVGAAIGWVGTSLVPALQESGVPWMVAAGSFLPMLVNLVRKWLTDTTVPSVDEPQAPMMGVARGDIFQQITDAEQAGIISPERAATFRERANSGNILTLLALALELLKLFREWRADR